jgi:hypothetical protein
MSERLDSQQARDLPRRVERFVPARFAHVGRGPRNDNSLAEHREIRQAQHPADEIVSGAVLICTPAMRHPRENGGPEPHLWIQSHSAGKGWIPASAGMTCWASCDSGWRCALRICRPRNLEGRRSPRERGCEGSSGSVRQCALALVPEGGLRRPDGGAKKSWCTEILPSPQSALALVPEGGLRHPDGGAKKHLCTESLPSPQCALALVPEGGLRRPDGGAKEPWCTEILPSRHSDGINRGEL